MSTTERSALLGRAPFRWLWILALVGCGEGTPTPDGEGRPAASDEAPSQAEPRTVLDLFPEDAARDLLLGNCASCHAVACAAMGQRTPARWNALREGHVEHASGLPAEDLDRIFAYLEANFSDAQPEPTIPPAFLEGGCTPF